MFAQEAVKRVEQIGLALTASTGPHDMTCFWNPLAWPDLLCAYTPWTRRIAVLHVLLALVIPVLLWNHESFRWFWCYSVCIWCCSSDAGTRAAFCLIIFFFLVPHMAFPMGYLWAVRYGNLSASCSKEASSLQADLRDMLLAVNTLDLHQAKLMPKTKTLSHSAPAQIWQASSLLLQLPQHSACSGVQSAQGMSCSDESDFVGSVHQPQSTASDNAVPMPALGILPVQEMQAAISNVSQRSVSVNDALDWSEAQFTAAAEEHNMFRRRLPAALRSAPQIIQNLTARLEALVDCKGGVHVQGPMACSAALAILAGEETSITTVPEALAAINIIGSTWPARNPRTPMYQFWRPSAWADALHAYFPQDRKMMDADYPPFTQYHVLADYRGRWILATILFLALKLGIEIGIPPPWVKAATMATFPFASAMWLHLSFHILLRQNLAVSNAKPFSSTRRLLRHLRQLDTAFAVFHEHAQQSRGRTGHLPSTSFPSGLVLLHAGHKYVSAKSRLMARLEAACAACMKKHGLSMPCWTNRDSARDMIEVWEYLIRRHPF